MKDTVEKDLPGESPGVGVIQRAFALIRALAAAPLDGSRVIHLAKSVNLSQPTVYRLLRALVEDGIVEQEEKSKLYRLSIEFFSLAAQAANPNRMRELCRPALLRLCASLGEAIFLFVRNGFDAVCLDMCDGPFPIRTFTGDVGGRVAMGVGHASVAILAFLPVEERDEIIRFNIPRLQSYGVLDEVHLRSLIERTRAQGYIARNDGVLEGMAGAAVPILDRRGYAIGALSIGTLSSRLSEDRLSVVVELLKREAEKIGPNTNPFDVGSHRSSRSSASQTKEKRK